MAKQHSQLHGGMSSLCKMMHLIQLSVLECECVFSVCRILQENLSSPVSPPVSRLVSPPVSRLVTVQTAQ